MTKRYKLWFSAEIKTWPKPRWLIRDLLMDRGLGLIVGSRGAGKSFLALDMAAALADGSPSWYGLKIEQSYPVVMISLEGESGIQGRVEAWERHHARPIACAVVVEPFLLHSAADIADLIASVREIYPDGCMLVIDTLYRAALGSDENTSEGMALVIGSAAHISRGIGGPVLLVHHLGKDIDRGPRGHSSLGGATDLEINVKKDKSGARTWNTGKVKDGPDDHQHAFTLQPIEIGYHGDGASITSCVAIPNAIAPERPLSPNQRLILDSLSVLGCPTSHADLLSHVRSLMSGEERKKSERLREAVKSLLAKHLLQENNSLLSIC